MHVLQLPLLTLFRHSAMALGLWIITGAHVLGACYVRSVLFPRVLGPRVEAGSKSCLHTVLKRSSESHPCISYLLTVFTSMTVTGRMCKWDGKSGCFSCLIPGMRLPTSFYTRGGRWGNLRGICCRSELKMLDVAPPQISNLYSHLDLSPLFPLSSWACYS